MVTNESDQDLSKVPPVCINCGVSPDFNMIKSSLNISRNITSTTNKKSKDDKNNKEKNVCPACTFVNHSQIRNCEICGTRLPNANIRHNRSNESFKDSRINLILEKDQSSSSSMPPSVEFVQVSFRKSDGVLFTQATEKTLQIFNAKNNKIFNQNVKSINGVDVNANLPLLQTNLKKIGITSLERSRENQLLNNDILFNNALSDLNSLISLANNIERLYRSTKNSQQQTNSSSHRIAKKPALIIDREKFYNKELFLDEIAREIYDFAMSEFNETTTTTQNENIHIMVTLVDFYAIYNKSMRIGTGLISPLEMKEACQRFEKLGLNNLKLTRINNRVLCLSTKDSFNFVKSQILSTIDQNPGSDLLNLTNLINTPSTKTANNNKMETNNWTIGVIMEILQNCVDEGDLLIDEQISGIYYYMNTYWKV